MLPSHGPELQTAKATALTMIPTISCGFLMEFISLNFIATHSDTVALFVLYLFVRYYRSQKFVDSDSANIGISPTEGLETHSKHVANKFISKHKPCDSISNGRRCEVNSLTALQTSPALQRRGAQYDLDDALSQLESDIFLKSQSTFHERRRFVVACKGNLGNATSRLDNYLRWRNEHVKAKIESGINIKRTVDQDYDLWVECCLIAMKISGEVENIVLPRIIRLLVREDKHRGVFSDNEYRNDRKGDFRDLEGYRTFCIRPALIDMKLAKASTYTLAVAIYLDRSIDRQEAEKVTVCVDVRAGRGNPNPHVLQLIPFMKHSMKILLPLFPERLHRALVYPVPAAFFYVWKMISTYMDPLTVERVCLLEGKCKIEAPPPTEKLQIYFGEEELQRLESSRIEGFRA